MREILFRGKRVDNGEWVEGCFGRHTSLDAFIIDRPYPAMSGELSALGFYEVDPATVGQFTELYDKNGEKIFEGDIVQYYGTYALEVFIEKGHTKFRWFDAVTNTKCAQLFFDSDEELGECEVSGNIHDNPELLEG